MVSCGFANQNAIDFSWRSTYGTYRSSNRSLLSISSNRTCKAFDRSIRSRSERSTIVTGLSEAGSKEAMSKASRIVSNGRSFVKAIATKAGDSSHTIDNSFWNRSRIISMVCLAMRWMTRLSIVSRANSQSPWSTVSKSKQRSPAACSKAKRMIAVIAASRWYEYVCSPRIAEPRSQPIVKGMDNPLRFWSIRSTPFRDELGLETMTASTSWGTIEM